MKRAEVQLPDPLYQQVKGLAEERHLSVSDVLCQAVEQLLQRQARIQPGTREENWHFPEGRHLGAFLAPAEDWRLLA